MRGTSRVEHVSLTSSAQRKLDKKRNGPAHRLFAQVKRRYFTATSALKSGAVMCDAHFQRKAAGVWQLIRAADSFKHNCKKSSGSSGELSLSGRSAAHNRCQMPRTWLGYLSIHCPLLFLSLVQLHPPHRLPKQQHRHKNNSRSL